MMDGLNKFCGSPFWDANISWYTESPSLTPCFEQTVLVWIPCFLLWIFSLLDVYYIISSKSSDIPWNWRNTSKIMIISLLLIICIFDFIYAIKLLSDDEDIYSLSIYTPILKFISFALCCLLILYHRSSGIQSSGVQFIFWLLLSAFGVPRLITNINSLSSQNIAGTPTLQITYFIYYCLSVSMLFLNFFADLAPRNVKYAAVENPSPESSASFPSRITFSWFNSMTILGFKRPITISDLWNLNYEDTSSEVVPKFDKYWSKSQKQISKEVGSKEYLRNANGFRKEDFSKQRKEFRSVIPPLCKAFGPSFLMGAFFKFGYDILQFVSPEILSKLIEFVKGDEPIWRGYLYAGVFFLTGSLQTILLSQHYNKMYMVGLRLRTAVISAIYRKSLRLSNNAKRESTVGEVVNLMSVDAESFAELTVYLNVMWSAPIQIGVAMYFLWRVLGPSVFAGLAVMLILIPINASIVNKTQKIQMSQMKKKDERVKMMNEILSGLKVLKLYAWEPSFKKVIMKTRNKELNILKHMAFFSSTIAFIWTCAPFLVVLVTFSVYVLTDENNILDSQKAFVSLSLFNILRLPLFMLPMSISTLTKAYVSIKRINKFMNSEELDTESVTHYESEIDPVVMENGIFAWGSEGGEVLHNINLRVKECSLVAIVGAVGAGKSSLLSAFLGEMEKKSGKVNVKGRVAYVPQVAWMQNATLKDNILFGNSIDNKKYDTVIDACALKQDIEMLLAGDQTEIGEKGINLSGGQKQRISLARAVYYDADLYFLDDPLSAVDSHVGKHIFDNVIGPKGLLKHKTRLLVTHSITFLSECDLIVVMKDGSISEIGSYKELMEKEESFRDFLMHHLQELDVSMEDLTEIKQLIDSNPELAKEISRQQSLTSSGSFSSPNRKKLSQDDIGYKMEKLHEGKLIDEEKVETGVVKWAIYVHYLKSASFLLSSLTVISNIIYQCFAVGSNIWLSIWTSDTTIYVNGTQDVDKRDMYLTVYGAFGAAQNISIFFTDILPLMGCWIASKTLHNLMLDSLLHAPLSFTDITPLGRIISRFARDIDIIDTVLPRLLSDGTFCFFDVISTLVIISYSTPIFIGVIIPIGVIYYFIQRFYISTTRQLKRLEAISRSPIYSHFGETVAGATMIRAFNVQQRFIKESEEKVDRYQTCYYPGVISNRWLAVRLETVGTLIVFFAALLAVLGKGAISPGLVGLSITYALQITQTMYWLVQMTSDIETNIVAVERIKEYEEISEEAPWSVSPNPVNPEWPEEGKVEFRDFKVRYRKGLDYVLKGLTFTINPMEKVGIVGRTGAGKSSLTLSLFRIIEAASGSISIDGVDISKLGLHALRSRLTIIPQDPVLFSGSLRLNLDPYEIYSDEQIWSTLEHAHLKKVIEGLPAGLQNEVSEGGDNFSLGQRQLICLARALLRKTKVLILDEATAAIDLETDELIQNTIRTQFSSCTVLTIAHRINTIMDSDRVMVLDKGLLVEFDSPHILLQDHLSVFYGMARDAGLV